MGQTYLGEDHVVLEERGEDHTVLGRREGREDHAALAEWGPLAATQLMVLGA